MGACLACCFYCCHRWHRAANDDGDHIVIAEDGSVVHRTQSTSNESASLLPKNKKSRTKTQEHTKASGSNSIFIEPSSNTGGSGEILVRNTPGGASSYYDRPEPLNSASQPSSYFQPTIIKQNTQHFSAPSSYQTDSAIASASMAVTATAPQRNVGYMMLKLASSSGEMNSAPSNIIQAIVNDNVATTFTLSSEVPIIENVPVKVGAKNELLLRKFISSGQPGEDAATSEMVEDKVTWVLSDAAGRTVTIQEDLTLGEDAGEHNEMSYSEGTRALSVVNKNEVSVMVSLFHDSEEIFNEVLRANADAKLTQGEGVLPRGRPGKRYKNHLFFLSIQPLLADSTAAGPPCVYNLPDSDCDIKVRIQWSQEEEAVSLLPIKKSKKSKSAGPTRDNVTKEQLAQARLPSESGEQQQRQ